MANIKFSKRTFEKDIGKLDEVMQNKIAMFGTTLESFSDEEIELEIFPNRPDLLSYQGFKRSFLAFLGKKTELKEYKIKKPGKDFDVIIDSSVEKIRPYTACAIVKNLSFNDEKIKEIIDIQEKLHGTLGRNRKKVAIGIYPLEKIKLQITYKALEPDKIKFFPLEMDREMSGLEILQRHPTGRDYAHLLAGKEKFPIFIDAGKNILSMPPIINSHLTGKIEETTKEVFIECSGFDFFVLSKCLNILITTLAEMGGEVYQMNLKYGKKTEVTPDLKPEKMKLNLSNAEKHLGIKLNESQAKTFLQRMGYNYSKGIVEIPAWRTDILHEVDLIEDIAIAYGFETFVPCLPEVATIGEEDKIEILKKKIAEILSGLEMQEISNYHLTFRSAQFVKMGLNEEEKAIEVENSKTDYNILRDDLSHYALKTLSENIDSEYPQKIFELGRVFKLEKEEIKEKEHLSFALTPGNFTEAKQILEYLMRMLNLKQELTIEEPNEAPSWFIDGRTAEIKLLGKKIGYMGEVHPKILKKWHIKMPVVLCEINLEGIFEKLE